MRVIATDIMVTDKIIGILREDFKLPIIVLFSGKKRSGKDFIANFTKKILEKSNKKVEIIHFADSLKEVLCTTFNISLKELDNLKNSNTIIFNSLTMRNILQRFGTDAMQNIF